MLLVEGKVGIKRERFSLIEPSLGVLEGKEFPLAAPLTVKYTHKAWLDALATIQTDFDSLYIRHQLRPWV